MNDVATPQASPATTPTAPETPKPLTFEELSNLSGDQLDNLGGATSPKAEEPKAQEPIQQDDDDDDDDDEEVEVEGSSDEDDDEDEESDDSDTSDSDSEPGEEVFLEQKVNGKLMKFTEKQVRQIVASGAHNLQKMQQWESERSQVAKQLDVQKAEIAVKLAKIDPVFEKIKEKDVGGAIVDLATAAGVNKLEARRSLIASLLPVISQRLGLEPQWVQARLKEMEPRNRALDIAEEAQYYKELAEQAQKASSPQQKTPEEQYLETVSQLQIEHGVSRGEIQKAIEFLEVQSQGQNLQITPQQLIEAALMRRVVNRAFEAIRSVRPTLEEDNDFVDRVVKKARTNPDWGTDRLARWVEKKARQRADSQRTEQIASLQKDVSRKVLKQPNSGSGNPKAGQKVAMRFEDLNADSDLP